MCGTTCDRLQCIVPFCRRTTRNPEGYSAWMCRDHWKMVSKYRRRRDSRLVRRYVKKFGRNNYWEYKGGSPERLEALRLANMCAKSWELCKRQAIERAAGI